MPSSPNKRKAVISVEIEEHVQDKQELQKASGLVHVNGGRRLEDPQDPKKLNKGASPSTTQGGDAGGDGAAAGHEASEGGAKGDYALVAPGLGSFPDAPVAAPSWEESVLEVMSALDDPQEASGITNHPSPSLATNKDAAYDTEFKGPAARCISKPKPVDHKSETEAAAAAARELEDISEPSSLHELNQTALIHYKTELNRVLDSLGLPPSTGVTAGSQAGSKEYSMQDHKKHMLSIQDGLEEFEKLWEPRGAPAEGAGAGGDEDKGEAEDGGVHEGGGLAAAKDNNAGPEAMDQPVAAAAAQEPAPPAAAMPEPAAQHPPQHPWVATYKAFAASPIPVDNMCGLFETLLLGAGEPVGCAAPQYQGLQAAEGHVMRRAKMISSRRDAFIPVDKQIVGPDGEIVNCSATAARAGTSLVVTVEMEQQGSSELVLKSRIWLLVLLWHTVDRAWAKPENEAWQSMALLLANAAPGGMAAALEAAGSALGVLRK